MTPLEGQPQPAQVPDASGVGVIDADALNALGVTPSNPATSPKVEIPSAGAGMSVASMREAILREASGEKAKVLNPAQNDAVPPENNPILRPDNEWFENRGGESRTIPAGVPVEDLDAHPTAVTGPTVEDTTPAEETTPAAGPQEPAEEIINAATEPIEPEVVTETPTQTEDYRATFQQEWDAGNREQALLQLFQKAGLKYNPDKNGFEWYEQEETQSLTDLLAIAKDADQSKVKLVPSDQGQGLMFDYGPNMVRLEIVDGAITITPIEKLDYQIGQKFEAVSGELAAATNLDEIVSKVFDPALMRGDGLYNREYVDKIMTPFVEKLLDPANADFRKRFAQGVAMVGGENVPEEFTGGKAAQAMRKELIATMNAVAKTEEVLTPEQMKIITGDAADYIAWAGDIEGKLHVGREDLAGELGATIKNIVILADRGKTGDEQGVFVKALVANISSSEPVTVPEIESISAKVERLKADIANSLPLTENLASNLNPIGRKARMAERTAREKKLAEAVSGLMGVIGSEDPQVTEEDRRQNLEYILGQPHAKSFLLRKFPLSKKIAPSINLLRQLREDSRMQRINQILEDPQQAEDYRLGLVHHMVTDGSLTGYMAPDKAKKTRDFIVQHVTG